MQIMAASASPQAPTSNRILAFLRPSHGHTAFTATLLLMISAFLSRIIGLVREKYIAWLFGAGSQTDAYLAAFRLPELINYFLVGGVASITFVTLLNRYRERGEEAEGERVLSIILNCVLLVLGAGVLIGEWIAPFYTRHLFPGFQPWQADLCTHMTRILLPAQIFFFAGGALGAVLLVRKQFIYQAATPIIYNFGIIFGGVLLAKRFGISGLAIGATAGAFVGAFLINAIGVYKAGVRYRPILQLSHPGLHSWIKMTIPLMLGVTVVFLDDYFLSYFASHGAGDISRLNYAKRLFAAPMAILGQAAGAASLPFFASLWSKERFYDFAMQVANSVSRIVAIALLASAWMLGLAYPLVDIIFRGGKLLPADVKETSLFFSVFALSLFCWAAQGIYSRAFYAAGITLTPMIAGTLVTLVAVPIYWGLYHAFGAVGLAIASNTAILLQTVTLAVLLHKRRMVSIASLDVTEFMRCLLAGLLSYGALAIASHLFSPHGRFEDFVFLTVGTFLWLLVISVTLFLTGSQLPTQLIGRLTKRKA
jgi:putative peptidoglycan lipid II flippase